MGEGKILSAARRGRLCMEETKASPGGISLGAMLVPAARAIAPPAPTRRSDPALVVSPQRKGLWRISSKVRVARDAETCDPPWGRTWRAGGNNTEGTEGSRRCTVRPDVARSGREDAERTEGTDGVGMAVGGGARPRPPGRGKATLYCVYAVNPTPGCSDHESEHDWAGMGLVKHVTLTTRDAQITRVSTTGPERDW